MGEGPSLRIGRVLEVAASSIGLVAARAAAKRQAGVVHGIFERSFYVRIDHAWICFGSTELGAGPLNVLCAHSLLEAIPSLRDGGEVWRDEGCVIVAGALKVCLNNAERWTPRPFTVWRRDALAGGLAAFEDALPPCLPREGLALLLRGQPDNGWPSVAMVAQEPAQAVRRLVRGGSGAACLSGRETFARLIGLGPGLTPSGDDFLGGAMVALTCLGMKPLCDELWATLAPLASKQTNDISRAHLAAAAAGFGSAALHDFIDAVLTGDADAIPARLAALAAIGHTSGWDAMAGAIVVLRAVITR